MSRNTLFTIIAMIISGILGYYANVLANKKNNELLIQLLKDQLVCTNNEITTPTTGKVSDGRMQYLLNRKSYLEQQLNYYSQKFGIYT